MPMLSTTCQLRDRRISDGFCQKKPRTDMEGKVGDKPDSDLPERCFENAVLLCGNLPVPDLGEPGGRPGQS